MSALWVRLSKLLKSILWAWMEDIALSSGVEAPEPAPWCHHVWLAMDGGHGGARAARPGQLVQADQARSKSGQRSGATAVASGWYPAKISNFGCCQKWKTLAQNSFAQGEQKN